MLQLVLVKSKQKQLMLTYNNLFHPKLKKMSPVDDANVPKKEWSIVDSLHEQVIPWTEPRKIYSLERAKTFANKNDSLFPPTKVHKVLPAPLMEAMRLNGLPLGMTSYIQNTVASDIPLTMIKEPQNSATAPVAINLETPVMQKQNLKITYPMSIKRKYTKLIWKHCCHEDTTLYLKTLEKVRKLKEQEGKNYHPPNLPEDQITHGKSQAKECELKQKKIKSSIAKKKEIEDWSNWLPIFWK